MGATQLGNVSPTQLIPTVMSLFALPVMWYLLLWAGLIVTSFDIMDISLCLRSRELLLCSTNLKF